MSFKLSSQERDWQDHEQLLPTGPQHGLLLLRQQDHRLHHFHHLRSSRKHNLSQPRVCDGVAVRFRETHRHPLLPKRHREAIREPRQRPQDSGTAPVKISSFITIFFLFFFKS